MIDEKGTLLQEDATCPNVGYQRASICVPVKVTPFAKAGATMTKCCKKAVVVSGKELCEGEVNGSCFFTIAQDICVAVPVDFGAVAEVGETVVNCLEASAEDICLDCDKEEPVLPTEPVEPVIQA